MTTPAQPEPQPLRISDYVRILHNAGHVPPEHPRYAESRRVMRAASNGIRDLVQEANAAEGKPGKLGSAIVNFGQGASAGLAQTAVLRSFLTMYGMGPILSTPQEYQQYLAAARIGHPGASLAGQLAGMTAGSVAAGPAVAGIGAARGAAVLGGLQVGTQTGVETDDLATGLFSGAIGAALGGVGGKVLQKLGVGKYVGNFLRTSLSRSGAPEATVNAAAEGSLRRWLTSQGQTPEQIEEGIQAFRKTSTAGAAPQAPHYGPRTPVVPEQPARLTIPRGEALRQATPSAPAPADAVNRWAQRSIEEAGGAVKPPITQAARSEAQAKTLSFASLRRVLEDPQTPDAIQGVIRKEFERRGIVYNPSTP